MHENLPPCSLAFISVANTSKYQLIGELNDDRTRVVQVWDLDEAQYNEIIWRWLDPAATENRCYPQTPVESRQLENLIDVRTGKIRGKDGEVL